jgi:hypothetical protein
VPSSCSWVTRKSCVLFFSSLRLISWLIPDNPPRPIQLYIVDKAENNPHKINGHPAWAAEYKIGTNAVRLMDVVTNTFCAGGNVLGNGTWLNVGGNQGVTYGGNPTDGGDDPFDDADGGNAVRLLDPCNDGTCNWLDDPALYMSTKRWYASLETLSDGTMIIIGGDTEGGYVNSHAQNNPTYEFWPGNDDGPQTLEILQNSLPANLYPLTFLLPSDKLLIQTNWNTEIFDYKKGIEKNLPDIPHAVRTYPAGGGTTMLPMTPANNWTAVIIFCGGQNLQPNQWGQDWDMVQNPADDTCVTITPDVSTKWVDDDPLPQGRTMGNMINLPDGTIFVTNGGATGTEGYGNTSWAIGQSYADNPIYTPILYNPNAPAGSKWTQDGLTNSTILRLYHSVAMLLPDGTHLLYSSLYRLNSELPILLSPSGSVFIAGSNPNADVTSKKYATEYRSELWYPSYFSKTRPMPSGLLSQLSYGGSSFDVTLSSADLNGNLTNLETAYVVIVRTGFSTHVMVRIIPRLNVYHSLTRIFAR